MVNKLKNPKFENLSSIAHTGHHPAKVPNFKWGLMVLYRLGIFIDVERTQKSLF
jgi:hypothetical protein